MNAGTNILLVHLSNKIVTANFQLVNFQLYYKKMPCVLNIGMVDRQFYLFNVLQLLKVLHNNLQAFVI